MAKPCIQDKIKTYFANISREYNFVIAVLVLISFISIVFYRIIPDYVIDYAIFNTRTNYFITVTIVVFTFMQVYASHLQLGENRKRNKINDLINELEKAYGPLYSIFNPYFWDRDVITTHEDKLEQRLGININKSEKEKLDFILSNYPFMFKHEIFSYWREHLQYQGRQDDPDENMFSIDEEFIRMIYDEYYQRLEEYNNLLGKKSARASLVERFV